MCNLYFLFNPGVKLAKQKKKQLNLSSEKKPKYNLNIFYWLSNFTYQLQKYLKNMHKYKH